MIRVLVVDDHPFYRAGVAAMAPLVDLGIEVVGQAGNGAEAVAAAVELSPDVVLMDLAMPGMNGVEATRALVSACPGAAVLVLTMLDDDSVFPALAAGAVGYLLKDTAVEGVCAGIRAAASGEAHFSASIARRVVARLGQAAGPAPFPDLTVRENEVLGLLAAGRDTRAIARELFLTPKSVRNYISNIVSKLHVADRREAAERALAAGLGGPDDGSGPAAAG